MRKVVFRPAKIRDAAPLCWGNTRIPLFPGRQMVGGQRTAHGPVGITCTFILSAFSLFSYPKGPETPKRVCSLGVGVHTAKGAPWPCSLHSGLTLPKAEVLGSWQNLITASAYGWTSAGRVLGVLNKSMSLSRSRLGRCPFKQGICAC